MTSEEQRGAAKRGLLAWLVVQAALPLVVGLLAVTGRLGGFVVALPSPHGVLKQVIGMVHTLLVRQLELPWVLGGALILGLVLPALRGRGWWIAAVVAAALALALAPWGPLPVALLTLGLLLANLRPDPAVPRAVAWLPGVALVLPLPVLRALGVRRTRPLAPLAALALAAGWLVVDSGLSTERYARQVTAWPEALSDPRVTVVDRAPEGVHCEFHDVDVVGDRAVVVVEGSAEVRAYPLDGGPVARRTLPTAWEPLGGLVMDAETDPASGRTWLLDGPRRVAELRWEGGAFVPTGRAAEVPRALHHVYSTWLADQELLMLVEVNTRLAGGEPKVVLVDTRTLAPARVVPLHTPDGTPPPTLRDVAWVPPLGRLVAAPDFGDRLYLVDPHSGLAEPWLPVPTLNGKLVWVPGLDRLVITLPDRFFTWIVDPVAGRVERQVLTQPGARAAAVDVERGLLLTASVLTGTVLVQRLDDGAVVARIGTVMPMVRELALVPGRPEAWLTTWGSLYRVRYAEDL